jgi:biotin synthase
MREALTLHAQVQRCTLLSIKTGGCPETCTYCSQSSSWRKDTGLKAEKLMDLEDVYQARNHILQAPKDLPCQRALCIAQHACRPVVPASVPAKWRTISHAAKAMLRQLHACMDA